MISSILPIGEYLPDQQDFFSGGATKAENVRTNGDGYLPFESFQAQSDALADTCYGGYSHLSTDGTVTTFAATRTKIYKLSGTSWEDVTNTGGDYSTGSEGAWQFTQYGDRVIATNFTDKIQSFLVGTDTDFSDMITSGPDVKAQNVAVINNFVVTINVNDSDGETKNRLRWSPINNPTGDWTVSQSTQADFQNVEDGNPGEGMAVVGGQNYGVAFFKNAIHRIEYVGPPAIFSITLMATNIGAIHPNAVASNGEIHFFIHDSGMHLHDGVRVIPIGDKKIDETFKAELDRTRLHRLRATVNPDSNEFLVTYPTTGGGGINNKTIIYNWVDNRFTTLNEGSEFLFRAFSPSTTLEEIAATYPDLETVPYSLDSRFWVGGQTQLAAVNSSDVFGFYNGDPMDACIAGAEFRLNEDGTAYIESILPVYENGSVSARLGSRMLLNDSISYTPFQSPSSATGEVNIENEARYHRVEVQLTGSWSHFRGYRLRSEAAGGI